MKKDKKFFLRLLVILTIIILFGNVTSAFAGRLVLVGEATSTGGLNHLNACSTALYEGAANASFPVENNPTGITTNAVTYGMFYFLWWPVYQPGKASSQGNACFTGIEIPIKDDGYYTMALFVEGSVYYKFTFHDPGLSNNVGYINIEPLSSIPNSDGNRTEAECQGYYGIKRWAKKIFQQTTSGSGTHDLCKVYYGGTIWLKACNIRVLINQYSSVHDPEGNDLAQESYMNSNHLKITLKIYRYYQS